MSRVMNVPFLIMWTLAGLLWVYGLALLIRLKRYLTQQRRDGFAPAGSTDLAQMRLILRNTRHPQHGTARRMMLAYGGFLFCWIVGFGLSMMPLAAH